MVRRSEDWFLVMIVGDGYHLTSPPIFSLLATVALSTALAGRSAGFSPALLSDASSPSARMAWARV